MDYSRHPTQRSANRKRKSSLSNLLHPIPLLKRPTFPLVQEDEFNEAPEYRFEPTTLPDSSLHDLFQTGDPLEVLGKAEEKKLAFPIFTKQFVEHHTSKENEVQKTVSKVNHIRKQSSSIQRKNTLTVQQAQSTERSCRELRANNEQIREYLRNFRSDLAPLLSQLEVELGNPLSASINSNPLAFSSTDGLTNYLKDLGRRIWEYGGQEELSHSSSNPNHPSK